VDGDIECQTEFRRLPSEEGARQDQVCGARDREEFGQSLDDAQQSGDEQFQTGTTGL
jgi:hypothetical protein